jgi:hypothetical protein
MANFAYTMFLQDVGRGEFDFQETGDDMRIVLVMTNTTADTDADAEFLGDFVTLDRYDGANYADKALANQLMDADLVNNRGEFTADNIQWAALGAGTRQAQAMLLYKFVTNDAASPNIGFIDTGGFPFSGNGGNVDVTWNAQGILQFTGGL